MLNRWVENGAEALPAYLKPAAADLLHAAGDGPGEGAPYPALRALLERG